MAALRAKGPIGLRFANLGEKRKSPGDPFAAMRRVSLGCGPRAGALVVSLPLFGLLAAGCVAPPASPRGPAVPATPAARGVEPLLANPPVAPPAAELRAFVDAGACPLPGSSVQRESAFLLSRSSGCIAAAAAFDAFEEHVQRQADRAIAEFHVPEGATHLRPVFYLHGAEATEAAFYRGAYDPEADPKPLLSGQAQGNDDAHSRVTFELDHPTSGNWTLRGWLHGTTALRGWTTIAEVTFPSNTPADSAGPGGAGPSLPPSTARLDPPPIHP